MLIRGRVKDHRRLFAREYLFDQRGMLGVADDRDHRQAGELVFQPLLDLIERVLRQLEEYQPGGPITRDLAAQFGADRTARAGDQNHPVAQPLAQARAVQYDRVAAEQVVELYMAYRRQLRPPADQVFVRRHGQRLESRRRAKLRDVAAHTVRRRRQCDDHGAHAVTPDPQRQFRDGSQHAHVAQEAPLFRGVVVEETDAPPLSAVRELLGQQRAGLAGTKYKHRLAERYERAVEPMLLPDAVSEPTARHEKDQYRRIENEDTARHDRAQLHHHQHDRDRHRAQARREHDALQVRQAREAP